MNSKKEILDKFGQICVQDIFDRQYKFIKHDVSDLAQTEGYENLFTGMTEIQKKEIERYTLEVLKGNLFNFLKIFEEFPQFKLIYEEEREQVNLVEISEMLKAEPIIENGWIARFSEFVKDDEII